MQHLRWLRAACAACAALWLAWAPARAEPVQWTLPPSAFSPADGGSARGRFVYDRATQQMLFWDIVVDPGRAPFTSFRYRSGEVGHTYRIRESGTILFEYIGGAAVNGGRDFFFTDSLALRLPDGPGSVQVSPGGDSDGAGEAVTPNQGGTSVRSFPQIVTLTGVRLSQAAPGDVAGGCRLGPELQSGDPVDLRSGAFTYDATLLSGVGTEQPFSFEVYYDSAAAPGTGAVGQKWAHSYQWRLEGIGEPTVRVVRPDGAADYFYPQFDGQATTYLPAYPQIRTGLEDDGDGTFTYVDRERSRYGFDSLGRLESISDRNGRTASLAYDAGGRLISVVGPAPASRTAAFVYDARDRIVTVDYESGLMRVDLAYDDFDNLRSFTSATNPALTTRFAYDGAAGHLLEGTVGTGPADDVRFVQNVYDGSGRVVSQLDAGGVQTTFSYAANETTVTDPDGRTSTRTYDDEGRIVGAINRAGDAFSWSYDDSGNLRRVDGPRGARTMIYDDSGNLTGITNERGDNTGLIWDQESMLTGIVDGNGNMRSYTFDASGNLTGYADQVNNTTSYQHDPVTGRLIESTDASGVVSTNHYDPVGGELVKVTTATGDVDFTYDAMGNADSVSDQNGNVTRFAFEPSGQVASVTDAAGQTTAFANDAFGQVTHEQRPDGQAVSYERDPAGRVLATSNALGERIEYDYDAMGRMIERRDQLGKITRYDYNASGQMESSTDAMGGVSSATFDSAGRRLTVTDPNTNVVRFFYDSLGRVDAEEDPLGRRIQLTYNSAGSVSQTTDARFQSIGYGYDDAGQLITEFLPGDTINYTLDAEGRRVAATHAAGTTTTVYDVTLGRVASRTDELGNTVGYAYDAVGNLTTLTYSDGKTVTYTYDAMNRITSVRDWAGRTTTYTWGAGGSLERAELPDGSSVTYAYDLAGRVQSMVDKTAAGATTFAGVYQYDAAGRTTRADVTLPLEPTLALGTTVFTYDAAGQVATAGDAAFAYDADGNLTSGVIDGVPRTLVYDVKNRIVEHNGDVYRYDLDNRRIEATRNGVTTRYVWEAHTRELRLLEEQDAGGAILARYVYGVGLIGREDAATGAFSVYHYDKRGSTVALTDAAGDITDRYAYDPYGNISGRQGATPNPFTYGGRDGVFDDGNGLYHTATRTYIPSLARFAQRESRYRGSLARPGSLNRYAYVEGNPVDRVDPRGEWFTAAFAAVGAVTSAVSQVVSNAAANRPWYDGVAGAALEGAINGAAITLGPWGQAAAGAAGAALGNSLNQGIDLARGKRSSFDIGLVATDMAVGGAFGGVMGKFLPAPASPSGLLKNLPTGLDLVKRRALTWAEPALGRHRGAFLQRPVQSYLRKNLFAASAAVGNAGYAVIGGPGKGLSSHRFGATGVSGVIAGALGLTPEHCDLKPRDTGLQRWVQPGGQYVADWWGRQ